MNVVSIAVILGYLTLIIGTILYNGRKSKSSFKAVSYTHLID